MDAFQLVDLFPYLTWDCPLNDSNYAAILARIIASYIGKQEITLTMVGYQSEQRRINNPYSDRDIVMFRYKACCLSTNGSFYLIEEKVRKIHDWRHACDNKNLKYIGHKDINEKICVVDLVDGDNSINIASDDKKDEKDEKEKDKKDGKEVKLRNDFNWQFPLKQVSNTHSNGICNE